MAATAESLHSGLSIVRPGADAADAVAVRNELFRFRFGTADAGRRDGDGDCVFRLYIDSIGAPAPDEIWTTNGAVVTGKVDDFLVAECDEYLAAHIELDPASAAGFQDLTTAAYRDLLRLTREHGYPNLARVWNYFPGINDGRGDLELYRKFTAGRAQAFDELDYRGDALPAGTAIGSDPGTPFTISVLATRETCRMVENPRQISAYDYPREYGPQSPSFSRAVAVAPMSGCQLLISGTASILGHKSVHLDSPAEQTAETLRNLEELVRRARVETGRQGLSDRLLTNGYLRVYVRNPGDFSAIEKALRDGLVDDPRCVFLKGDICRSELLLEIEAAGGM
jgi:chorismate lyase/3-hydroxybenzoate synthase